MGFELEKAHHDISLAKHINIGKLIRRESMGAMVVSLFPRGAKELRRVSHRSVIVYNWEYNLDIMRYDDDRYHI